MATEKNLDCWFCGLEVDLRKRSDVFRFVSGWVGNRRQGGANQVRLMRDEGRVAHKNCVEVARVNWLSKRQEVMFPDV